MKKIVFTFSLLCAFLGSIHTQICVGTPGELEWHAWEGLYDGYFSELTADPNYPQTPDVVKNIFRLKSPPNYNDYYGTRVEGFLHVESNTSVQFNVTGDDQVQFYLSTDENPDNTSLVASLPETVGEEEHDEFPEQTSTTFNLIAGQYYYFEIIHVDRWGSDRFSIFWKTDLVSSTEWNVITAAYIYGVGCKEEICPEAGTPCNDGDASTVDDIEDGHCNCFGKAPEGDACVGERGTLTGYRYDGIPGGNLNDLYEASNFPGMPSTSEQYEYFGRESTNELADVGFGLQAYLTVPVSGNYKFNVTGDDNAILFLSSNEDPENKQAHQALVSGWTNMTDHDKYIYQSTSNIYLEKGKYYYMEINQKDGGGSEHFSAFWQTPFTEAGVWKRIPSVYFFDYECELACIPAGTLCDDGNPFTNDDQYDENCDCVGIPCSGPDCDSPLANYIPKEKCAPTDNLDNREESVWVSCERTANPNANRSDGHWIMYDLGERHELHNTQIWNYNVNGNTQIGMTAVAIDFSLDGSSWTEYGTYNWALATGNSSYSGFNGPNLNGTYARYILISSLDAGSSCKGLGKVAFSAVRCPLAGTPCDDGDILTSNDSYNNNCECRGSELSVNDCGDLQVLLGDSVLYDKKYSAIENVQSISQVAPSGRVAFVGGKSVILEPGFETNDQTTFIASIDPCDTPEMRALVRTRAQEIAERAEERKKDKINVLTVRKTENELIQVSYFIEKAGKATLEIYDLAGNKVYTLIDHDFKNQGLYHKTFRTKKLGEGNLTVKLITGETALNRQIPMVAEEVKK
ncbi:PA14 domain-containing protein [Portibacter lacus]|uniref:PA14 domain-containing protein n=1 Tax=Portibacter lacus TaxID=1099794 RepID=A0AA37SS46_9BACT|nr:PA14 domain-containing protein [Portibacter lacus]GLR17163.1 hypothetical protein GCM10007940_17780 [Portibacter lacus]